MALTTYYSNRLEILAGELSTIVSRPLASPLAEEIIIVQSSGMARWLSMYLAHQLKITANVRFPFPSAFLWETLRRLLPDVAETSLYDRPILTWRVLGELQDLPDDDVFTPLRAYIEGGDELRCFELARRIADSYDQYLVYRPDWIVAWEQEGKGEHWQAALWRRLIGSVAEPHRVTLQNRFLEKLMALDNAVVPAVLPQRVTMLGISALPQVQLDLLARLAQLIDVHLLLLNPCQEYWGDIVADRDIARRGADSDPAEQYLEVGNPLLASLGRQGRDFIDLLQLQQALVFERYEAPAEVDLLGCLQSDILHLHRRGEEAPDGGDTPKTPVDPADRSLQIHACHSPMREVEVLHDQLLALFAADPQLRPADVVVMTPDIEAYGPVIEAVFDSIRDERRIPFTIADRSPVNENPLVNAFLQLLELAGSRYQVNRLLALLEVAAIRRRFQLDADSPARIQHWLRETGIRWGIDRDARAALELPALHEHSWRAGLDRLLLGFALPGAGEYLHDDILPYDDVEGSEAQIMGRLQSFAEAAFGLHTLAGESYTLSEWSHRLRSIIDDFFMPQDNEQEQFQPLLDAIEKLHEYSSRAGFAQPVPLVMVQAALQYELAETAGPGGFFSGGVTFCTLVPMRSIPFQVVCLIGMNNDTYPRPHRPPDFDLMLGDFRKGDRSRRQDDRYLFLEALISARSCFYLSYVGSNIRDNSVIPPSVLVSELLDVIDQGFCLDDGTDTSPQSQILTRHPLQAFSRRYFTATGDTRAGALFSYSQELAELSGHAAAQNRSHTVPFIDTPLPEEAGTGRDQLDLAQLIRFFQHPARFFLRERLAIQLPGDSEPLADHEPFTLDGLTAYQLRTDLLDLQQTQHSAGTSYAIVRGGAALPHGQIGRALFSREWEGVQQFAGRLQRFLPDARQTQPLTFDLTIAGIRLSGRLAPLAPDGLFGYRLAPVTARDQLSLWLQHLLLNIIAPAGIEPVSRWLGQDREVILRPVSDAQAQLEQFLSYYRQGLNRPLMFFPKSAFTYVEAASAKNQRTAPEVKARQLWQGNERSAGEGDDPYYRLALRGYDPFAEANIAEFITLARQIVLPIFEHRENTG